MELIGRVQHNASAAVCVINHCVERWSPFRKWRQGRGATGTPGSHDAPGQYPCVGNERVQRKVLAPHICFTLSQRATLFNGDWEHLEDEKGLLTAVCTTGLPYENLRRLQDPTKQPSPNGGLSPWAASTIEPLCWASDQDPQESIGKL
ncbi:hypothetical protein EXN66_Car018612 [Channa argus]|uniref:Uncharacterized protein n=1 Tax=Channa argus TaxID=215402 RepID=A0A6G1QKD6_CHAAH|nr:hypothetical protein EXN66_Car018612 [Channa argus]